MNDKMNRLDPVFLAALCPSCPEHADCYNSTHCACKSGFQSVPAGRYFKSHGKCEGKEAVHTHLADWEGPRASFLVPHSVFPRGAGAAMVQEYYKTENIIAASVSLEKSPVLVPISLSS